MIDNEPTYVTGFALLHLIEPAAYRLIGGFCNASPAKLSAIKLGYETPSGELADSLARFFNVPVAAVTQRVSRDAVRALLGIPTKEVK